MSDNKLQIYGMDLFDEIEIYKGYRVMRVPGGWVLSQDCDAGAGGYDMTSCFIPYNNEFENN